MKRITSTASRQLMSFLSWWVSELKGTLEDLRSHLAPQWRRSLTVYLSRSHVQIVDGDPRNNPTTVELPISELATEPTQPLPDVRAALMASGRRIRLVFDPEYAFIRPLQMPLAALPHLDSAIALQKSKLLPMDAAALRTDFEIVAMDHVSGTVTVDLAAIKRSDIEPVEAAMQRWGLQLGSTHLGRPSDSRLRFEFGTADFHTYRYAMTRTDALLAGSAAVLAFCALGIFGVQAVRAQESLVRALTQTSTEAAAVLSARQRMIARLDTLSLVSESERAPAAAAVLSEVTAHLDRDAWLTTFELKGRDLRLVGLSPDPAVVVKELAASALVGDVELRSSMSAANTGKDRFEITAQVRAVK